MNLLQPQDRRSLAAGDARAVVAARATLGEAGLAEGLIRAVAGRAVALELGDNPCVVDLGSGTGDALGALARERAVAGVGIDLSTAAAAHAARRFPDLTWVVANADRRLPIIDAAARLVLSLHARRNPAECARVLSPGGFLIVAVPAPDDLVELRTLVQGRGVLRDRADKVAAEHADRFALVERFAVRARVHLAPDALVALLRTTYRGARAPMAEPVAHLTDAVVTMASDVMLFARRP